MPVLVEFSLNEDTQPQRKWKKEENWWWWMSTEVQQYKLSIPFFFSALHLTSSPSLRVWGLAHVPQSSLVSSRSHSPFSISQQVLYLSHWGTIHVPWTVVAFSPCVRCLCVCVCVLDVCYILWCKHWWWKNHSCTYVPWSLTFTWM